MLQLRTLGKSMLQRSARLCFKSQGLVRTGEANSPSYDRASELLSESVCEKCSRKRCSSTFAETMISEELHLNQAFESIGVEAVETDLGEYILQLADEKLSHIIIPAIHKNRYQIAYLVQGSWRNVSAGNIHIGRIRSKKNAIIKRR
jgi:hypothetical protein